MPISRKGLEQALGGCGLQLRGGFAAAAPDALPGLPGGAAAAVIWLVGQVGSACWPAFSGSAFFRDGLPNPMDRWSKSIGDALARQHGGLALYPSDGPPYWPFQRWAARAEALQPSPLGLRIHPQWGLWHAYRFALLLPELGAADAAAMPRAGTAVPAAGATPESGTAPAAGAPAASPPAASPPAAVDLSLDSDICGRCSGQPCLHACPVDAFSGSGYDVGACATHLRALEGGECMHGGCLARRACPVAPQLRYLREHAAFHMRAFMRRR